MTASIVYLNNVRLETGFAKDHHELTYTKTARYTLAIQEGKIQAIIPNIRGSIPNQFFNHGRRSLFC